MKKIAAIGLSVVLLGGCAAQTGASRGNAFKADSSWAGASWTPAEKVQRLSEIAELSESDIQKMNCPDLIRNLKDGANIAEEIANSFGGEELYESVDAGISVINAASAARIIYKEIQKKECE